MRENFHRLFEALHHTNKLEFLYSLAGQITCRLVAHPRQLGKLQQIQILFEQFAAAIVPHIRATKKMIIVRNNSLDGMAHPCDVSTVWEHIVKCIGEKMAVDAVRAGRNHLEIRLLSAESDTIVHPQACAIELFEDVPETRSGTFWNMHTNEHALYNVTEGGAITSHQIFFILFYFYSDLGVLDKRTLLYHFT